MPISILTLLCTAICYYKVCMLMTLLGVIALALLAVVFLTPNDIILVQLGTVILAILGVVIFTLGVVTLPLVAV